MLELGRVLVALLGFPTGAAVPRSSNRRVTEKQRPSEISFNEPVRKIHF